MYIYFQCGTYSKENTNVPALGFWHPQKSSLDNLHVVGLFSFGRYTKFSK